MMYQPITQFENIGREVRADREDEKAMTHMFDLTCTFVQKIDADPEMAEEVLATIDPMRSLVDRLMSLGLNDRVIWSRTGAETYSLIWHAEGH
jgi:hypothetical protein